MGGRDGILIKGGMWGKEEEAKRKAGWEGKDGESEE